MAQQGVPVLLPWVVVDGLGAVCVASGVFGLVGRPEGALATLATPALAWSLIGLGGVAMAVAMSMIVSILAQHRREARQR